MKVTLFNAVSLNDVIGKWLHFSLCKYQICPSSSLKSTSYRHEQLNDLLKIMQKANLRKNPHRQTEV